jgi:O-antigen ligase
MNIGADNSGLSLSRLVGYGFMLIALVQGRLCFRRPPRAFWCFAVYLGIYTVLGALQDVFYREMVVERVGMLAQMLVLFWISYNLMRHERLVQDTLLALAASCAILAVLQLMGVTASVEGYSAAERISALRENLNSAAAVLSLGLLMLIGLAYGRARATLQIRLCAWPLFVVVGIPIIWTGSRGALVALTGGLLAFLLRAGPVWVRLRNALIALLAIGFLVWNSYHTEAARTRWERTLTEGSLAQREQIYPRAWEMVLERPLIGWGPVNHTYELGARVGTKSRDTHNLFLWVLTECGLVGAIPFCVGLFLCLRAGWRARGGAQGILPFALVLTVLLINMSGTWHNRKLHWLILAYALAGGSCCVARKPRGTGVLLDLPHGQASATSYS